MAVKSITDLLIEANLIKNATIPSENTALRVGGTLVDMIDSQFQGMPPTPQVEYDFATAEMRIYFLENGFDFTTGNPEIFLFRWKGKTNKKRLGFAVRKVHSGWKHPATVNASTKWAGWKFFNGNQFLYGGAVTNTRITEWSVPSTIKPYDRTVLTGFNRFMFFTEVDHNTNTLTNYDVNILGGGDYLLNDKTSQSFSNLFFKLSGPKRSLKTGKPFWPFPKVTTYAFALAIDNPYATKTNGLCPKIFSQLSAPMSAVWTKNGSMSYNDVVMVAGNNNRLARAVTIKSL